MDEIIKIVFFLIILGIGALIKRANEKAQENQRTKNAPRTTRVEDLPEATRRMIYGSTDVPTARPARQVVVDEDEDLVNDERIEPSRERAPEKPDLVVLLRQMAEQAQSAGQASRTPPPVARPAPARPAGQSQMRRVSMEPEMARPMAPPQPPPRKQQPKQRQAPPPPVQARVAAAAPAAKAPEQRRERKPAPPLRSFLRDLDDVRRGIILAEVLGTPKGLQ